MERIKPFTGKVTFHTVTVKLTEVFFSQKGGYTQMTEFVVLKRLYRCVRNKTLWRPSQNPLLIHVFLGDAGGGHSLRELKQNEVGKLSCFILRTSQRCRPPPLPASPWPRKPFCFSSSFSFSFLSLSPGLECTHPEPPWKKVNHPVVIKILPY